MSWLERQADQLKKKKKRTLPWLVETNWSEKNLLENGKKKNTDRKGKAKPATQRSRTEVNAVPATRSRALNTMQKRSFSALLSQSHGISPSLPLQHIHNALKKTYQHRKKKLLTSEDEKLSQHLCLCVCVCKLVLFQSFLFSFWAAKNGCNGRKQEKKKEQNLKEKWRRGNYLRINGKDYKLETAICALLSGSSRA